MRVIMKKINFLYLIIFLEGYIVLSAELLAIRQLTSFVGSGTDTVSIIIAAILMPLALGYYAGGNFKEKQKSKLKKKTIRQKLQQNIFIAAIFLTLGLSYIITALFFEGLSAIGIQNRLLSTSLYALIFLVYPIYLLAQTIPLISNFFSKDNISRITGKMLCFSTVGSFMGALFSTLVLMATLGVHHTVSITILCLCVLYIALSKKKTSETTVIIVFIGLVALALNSNYLMKEDNIIENNQYNTIRIFEGKKGLHILSLNHNNSSAYTTRAANPNKKVFFGYAKYINRNFIDPISTNNEPKRSILVLGAGGFTIGLEDKKNDYVFVDIDGSLKNISEQHFLKEKLSKNKRFETVPARGYLRKIQQTGQKFDLIIIDTYLGAETFPEHLVTQEFFQDIKSASKDNGIIIGNFLTSINFDNAFSVNLDNTLRTVFPHITRQIIPQKYNGWAEDIRNNRNILYIYHNKQQRPQNGIYTDNKNRVYYDKNKRVKWLNYIEKYNHIVINSLESLSMLQLTQNNVGQNKVRVT